MKKITRGLKEALAGNVARVTTYLIPGRKDSVRPIPDALLAALVQYQEFENADADWLIAGLKSLDESEQRKLIKSFRRQIWNTACQTGWKAAAGPLRYGG